MNVDSILISDYANVDTNGKLTVVGVFQVLSANNPPATPGTISVSVVIHGHAKEAGAAHELEIHLINERRDMVTPEPHRMEFTFPSREHPLPGLPLRVTKTLTMLGPSFHEAGAYAFEVYIDGTYHAAASFYVHFAS